MKLDRDWYMTSEGGAMDDEYNPLSQYDDLDAKKTAELAAKQVVSCLVLRRRETPANASLCVNRRRSLRDRPNM